MSRAAAVCVICKEQGGLLIGGAHSRCSAKAAAEAIEARAAKAPKAARR